MSPRRLYKIPEGVLKATLYVLVVTGLLVFTLSRTQMGRMAIKRQVEQAFNDRFYGQLSVGTLQGNLITDLSAWNVRLLDPEGRTVVQIDSVTIRPTWLGLLNDNISARSVKLTGLHINLESASDSTWNVSEVFRRRRPPPRLRNWIFSDVEITNGTLVATNHGPLPPLVTDSTLFDFTNNRIDDLQAQLTVEWERETQLIDIHKLSGWLDSARLPIQSAQGQFVRNHESLNLNAARIRLPDNDIRFSASLRQDPGTTSMLANADLSLMVQSSRFELATLRQLFPKIPQAGQLEGSGQITGRLNNLTVDRFRLAYGQSLAQGDARIRGLPDSAAFSIHVLPGTRVEADVLSFFLNTAEIKDIPFSPFAIQGSANGVVHLKRVERPFAVHSAFQLDHEAGSVAGDLEIKHTAELPLMYALSLQSEALNPTRLYSTVPPGSLLSGRAVIQGQGTTWENVLAQVSIELGESQWAGRSVDSLQARIDMADRQVTVQSRLIQGAGRLNVQGQADLRGTVPQYRGEAIVTNFDVGPWIQPQPTDSTSFSTQLNTTLRLSASGSEIHDAQGLLAVQMIPSTIIQGSDTTRFGTSLHTLNLRRPTPMQTHLDLDGDWVEGSLSGHFDFAPLLAVGTLWTNAFLRTTELELDKPFREPLLSAVGLEIDQEAVADEREQIRTSLAQQGFIDLLWFEGYIHIKQGSHLAAFFPDQPMLATTWQSGFQGRISPDAIDLNASLNSPGLLGLPIQTGPVQATFHLDSPFDYTLTSNLTTTLQVETDQVQAVRRRFDHVDLTLQYQNRHAELKLSNQPGDSSGTVDLQAFLDLLPDRNRLTLPPSQLKTSSYHWTSQDTAWVDFYIDALVVPEIRINNRRLDDSTETVQHIYLAGTLSENPSDMLDITAQNIQLLPLSEWLTPTTILSGVLDASFHLNGTLDAPAGSGSASIKSLSLKGHDLGHLTMQANYAPARSHPFQVDIHVKQDRMPEAGVQQNDVEIAGAFRLPTRSETEDDPGVLNLNLTAHELDLFFFDYIFSNFLAGSRGIATGRGSIQGTFSNPIFNASMEAVDAGFVLPDFNLDYTLNGPFTIDREGFHFYQIQLGDETGGEASISGDILFNQYRFFSFNLAADVSDLLIMNVASSRDLPFYGHIWGSGTATLTGPLYNALFRTPDAVTHPRSELFIPITELEVERDETFITYADSTGAIPIFQERRANVLAARPQGERRFLDGLNMNINVQAPSGSTVHLVFDPLLGDVVDAVGSGRVQIELQEGVFSTYGTFNVDSGDYLFTASDVFARRFLLASGGTITWDGDPFNARLDLPATYRTRASLAGLPVEQTRQRIPLVIEMNLTNRVFSPLVDLQLRVDRDARTTQALPAGLETLLNQSDRAAEYATSVLLTNTFLLTTSQTSNIGEAANELFFNSLSHLVTSQLNRFASQALNLDVNLGIQQRSALEDFDLTYGFALRLGDERLVIRGEGVYTGGQAYSNDRLQGALTVEYQLNDNVLLELFYRREDDFLQTSSAIGTAYGAGLVYQTEFANWKQFRQRIRGQNPSPNEANPPEEPVTAKNEGSGGEKP